MTQHSKVTPISAGAMAVTGMFLPWAHVGRFSVSGWRGSANFVGVPCPGFFVVIVAAVAIHCLCTRPTSKAALVSLAMSAYGIFHAGFMALALFQQQETSVGIGIPVTILSFVLITFCSFRESEVT